MNWLFKKKMKEGANLIVRENRDFKNEIPKKKSWLEKLWNINTDYDFKLFNTKRFIIGSLILLISPAIASLSSFAEGQYAEGKCIKKYFSAQMKGNISIIEFYPKDNKEAIQFSDVLNEFQKNEKVDLLYLPMHPEKTLVLTFYELYSNIWTGICIGLLIIWSAGYYASKD